MGSVGGVMRRRIRNFDDFKKGVHFKDVCPLLRDGRAYHDSIDALKVLLPDGFKYIVGIESRGFPIEGSLAYALEVGLVLARKDGKLPGPVVSVTYDLEYGTAATLQMQADAIEPGSKVVIVDDLLATGGSAKAVAELVEKLGGVVQAFAFFIELENLGGRKVLVDYLLKKLLERREGDEEAIDNKIIALVKYK